MRLTSDEAKRQAALEQRGLDFARVKDVFDGAVFTQADRREDYGEVRNISVGGWKAGWWLWSGRHARAHIPSYP